MKYYATYEKNYFHVKNKCRLIIGSTFIFGGHYCKVIKMGLTSFQYYDQVTQSTNNYMSYPQYLKTNSAAGRKLHLTYF